MLTEVKKQLKVTLLSIKYGIMREMLNKTTFIMNILFMIINNAAFIIQWLIVYSLKSDIGGYSFKQVLLVWGFAAGSYGVAHFFFKKSFFLADTITNGKLDSYLVQPKNVLLSAITSDVESSALGDIIYAYIMLVLSGFSIPKFILFTLFSICGGIITVDVAVIFASFSFWFRKADTVSDAGNNLIVHFATYPGGIFNGVTKLMLYTIIPVGIIDYIPVSVLTEFSLPLTLIVFVATIIWTCLAFIIFYRGLKKYSSSNLMVARI